MSSRRALATLFVLSCTVLFPTFASAALVEFRVLVDADRQVSTGCTVSGMQGVDHLLVTRVDVTETGASVHSSYRMECPAGVFGAQLDPTTGWGAGLRMPQRLMWFETRMPYSAFGDSLPVGMRFGFEAKLLGSSHTLLTKTNGQSMLFPPTSVPRRRSTGDARAIVMDDKSTDWGEIEALVQGNAQTGNEDVRILKVMLFGNGNDDQLYFGFESFISSDFPYAQNDNYSRKPGEGLTIAAPGVLNNDGDPNGAPLTALPVVQAKHGDVDLRPDGSFTYSPDNPNNPRTDSFEYKANNGSKDSNVARVKIKVSFGNDGPVGVDDHYTGTEDVQLAVPAPGVLTNDTDPDGDELTAALLAAPAHGTVALNANGGFTYSPQADFFGTDTFTYTLSDGEETDTAKVTITVESANDDPVALDVNRTTNEEQAVSVTLSASDPEGDPLTYNVGTPSNGVLSGTAPNLTYTPNPDFFGIDTFTYTATDGSDTSNIATVTITVNPVNDPPFFTSGGNVTSAEDVAYNAAWATGISAGAPNESSQTLTFNITNNTNPALFASGPSISASGVLTFTPALNANGSADITVTLSDNGGGANTSAPATFTITITPVNDPPTFTSGGNVTVNEDSGAYSNAWGTGISAGPADEAGQTLTFNVTNNTNPGLFNGAVTIASNGTLSFTPALNMFGSADITVTLSDNGGGTNTSAPVTFTITVTGVNDEPSFTSGGNVTVNEDSGAYSNAWATAINPGPNEGTQTVTFTVTNNTNSGLFLTQPAVAPDGTLTFTPNANANGSADITVEMKDNGGTAGGGDDTSAPVTFTINVTAVNDAPSFTSGGNVTVNEDGPAYNAAWATSISKGPADENTQTLTFNITGNTNAGLFATGPAIDAAGNLSFTLNANLNGSADITVTLSDNGGGATDTSAPVTFTINVTPVNDEPTFTSGGNVSSNEDTPYSAAWATAISKGPVDENAQTLTFVITNNTNAGLFQTGPAIDASGNLSYTPALNATGSADITVHLTDSGSNSAPNDNTSASVTFTITILPLNDAPVITAGGTRNYNEADPPITLEPALTITDVDSANVTCVASNDCYVIISGNPDTANDVLACPGCAGQGITASWSGAPSMVLSLTGAVPMANYQAAMRTVTFANNSEGPGLAQRGIDWYIKDGGGLQNADSLLNDTLVNVAAVNDAPVNTVPGAQNTDEDFPLAFNGNVSIADVDALTNPVKVNLAATNGTLTLSGTTGLTFTTGTGTADAAMELTGTIADINAALNGMTFNPTPDYNGAGSFSILTNDQGNTGTGGPLSSNAGVPNVVTINIAAVNDAPTFVSGGNVTVNEDSGAYNAAWATSISKGPADENGQTLTFNITGNTNAGLFASGPTIDASGNLQFTLNANLNGSADITVTLSDDGSNVSPNDNVSDPVTFTITVTAVNDEPAFTSGGNVTSNEDEAYSAAWATGISKGPADESGQTLTFNVTNNTNAGLFQSGPSIDASGNLTYTPALNANGSADITVNLTDDGSNVSPNDNTSASVTFTITVSAINDPPSFVSGGNVTVNEDSSAYNAAWATSLSKGPADESGQTLTAFNVTGNTNAGLFASGPSIDPGTGFLSFTLNANVNGSADITVTLSDNGSNVSPNDNTSDPVTFTITVTAVNDEPTFISGGNVTSNEDEAYSAAWATGISKGPADESGQTLTFNVTNNTNAGLFQSGPAIDASGNLTYTPALNANGSADITVNLTDDGSNVSPNDNTSASVTFTITITAINDPPSFVSGGNVTVNEDSSAYNAAWATSLSKGPADESGQTLTAFNVTGNTNAGLFASGPSIDPGTGFLSFTLNANVNGSADITVTLSDNGSNVSPNDNTSDPVTFTITVTAVNDEPAFTSGGNVTSNEDEAYSAAWATGISKGPADESGQTLTFNVTNNTNAGLFQSGPSIDASGNLTYTPALNANGSADITVNLTDDGSNVSPNDNTSASVTFTITVSAINDPPTFVSGGNVTVNEDSGAYNAAWATSISKGPADENGQTLTFNITGNTNAGLFASGPTIDASGNLQFTLNANLNGSADITVTLSDDGSNVSPNDNVSDPVTFTITVDPVNDEPSFTSGGDVATNEDTPFSAAWATGISKGPADENGQTLTFNVTNNSNPGLFQIAPSITAAGVLSFTPAANANGTASITVELTDSGSNVSPNDNTSAPVTFTITVNAVNDEPSFTIAGDPPFIGINAGPQTVLNFATLINDGDPELTQTLTFTENVTATTGTLAFDSAPSINESTGTLSYTVTNGTQGTATVSVTLSDDGSNVSPNDNISPAQVFTIVVEVGPTVTSTTPLEGATTVSPSDDIVINFSEPVFIDAGGLTINCGGAQTYTATPVAGGSSATHTFNPDSNLPSTNCVVTLTATAVHDQDTYDGPDNLPGDFTLNFTVNTPPVANNDKENALGNLTLTVSDADGVILDGNNDDDDGAGGNDGTDGKDIDPDPGATLTIQAPLTQTLGSGATITFTPGGGYTYHSAPGATSPTVDVFTYTLVDNNGATDTATLSISVGQRYIFVDDTGTPGDGRDITPFHTLQAAQTGSTTNDKIIVYSGNYTDFITLQSGQHLIGQGIDANLTDTFNGDTFTVLTSGASPSLARSTAGATITLGSNNTLRGALIGSSAGAAISGTGFGTLTIGDDLDVNATGGAALNLTTGSVSGSFDVLSAAAGANNALNLSGVGGTVAAASGSLSSTTATTINISGGTHALTYPGAVSTTGTSVFSASGKTAGTTTLSGGVSGSGGLNISNSNGATFTFTGLVNISTGTTDAVVLSSNFGTVSFSGGLQLATTTAATGFSATGGGTLTITGGSNTITTGAATTAALLMNGITLSGATFANVTSTGAATGVSLTSLGNGNVTINGGTINGGTTGYSLNTLGTSTVTLAGVSIGNVTPPTTAISGTTFGTLAISGAAVNVTGVTALTLSGGAMSGTFNNVTATAGNVSLTNITSASAWGTTGGAITGTAAAPAFNVSGGTSSINWGGTISQALANRVISIAGGHSTGTINFNNTVSSTGTSTGAIFTASSGTYNLNGTGPSFTNTFSSTDNAATAITISDGEAGNISFSTGTTITATGHSFHVDGSVNPVTTVINYRGTINKASGGSFITVNNLDTPGSLNMTRGAPNTPASGDLTMSNNGGGGISVTNCDNASITISNASLTYNNVAAGFAASANTGTTAINLPGLFLDGNGNKAGMLISGAGTITVNSGAANPTIDLSGGSAAASRAIDGTTTSFTGTLNLTNATITGNANADIVTLTGSTLGGSGSTISGANDALVLSGVTLTTGAGMTSVTSTGGTNGISLTNTSGATAVSPYTIAGGSLSGNSGAAFNVSTGTSNFTYGGSITQNTAGQRAVNITGITGGVITLSGAVGSNGGTGINLTGTGGTVTISGQITLNNTGATYNASGVGLTVNVTNTNNTIGATNAATGPGVNIDDATIGASNVRFQKVSTTGGANGIFLDNTGTSGGLIISGNGGTCTTALNCTGGAIQNATNDGISANNTNNLALTNVFIGNPGVHGIDATGLRGTNTLTASVIQDWANAAGNGFNLVNNNVNLTSLIVSGTTFNGTATGNDGFFMEAQGTSNMTVSIEGNSTFTDIFGDGAEFQTIGGSSGNVNVTVKNSTFNNAAAVGNGGIQMDTVGNANFTALIDNNSLDTIMRPLTNLGAIGGTNGETADVNITISNNTLNNIIGARGITYSADGSGANVFLIDNNNVDRLGSTTKYAIQLNMISSNGEATITNNDIGQQAALWTSGNGTAEAVFLLTQNASTMAALITGNVIDANATLEVIRARAIGTSNMAVTMNNNNVEDTVGAHVGELALRTENTATGCFSANNNTLPGGGVGVILLSEGGGTLNVTQASAAALSAANSNATVSQTGTPTFGAAACTLP